jgi:ribonuclease-3
MEYNPYNPKNVSFKEKDILNILLLHGVQYTIKNPEIFQNAMVHSSYVSRSEYVTPQGELSILVDKPSGCLGLFPESYERLEHLGDSVLGAITATYLSKRFPQQQEGFLTNLRKEIVCNAMLGTLTQIIGLDKFYVISRHNEDVCAGRTNTKKLGDILEAFIGALWTDSDNNFPIVQTFVVSLIEKYIDIPKILQNDTNFKDQLQKYCQTFLKYTPVYKMVSSINGYTMIALGQEQEIGRGSALTKKQAEQLAAQDALVKLKN